MNPRPRLRWFLRCARPSTVVVLLHGGEEQSTRPVWRLDPSWLRMWDFAWAVARCEHIRRRGDVAVVLVRNSVRGWNGGGTPGALHDGRSAVHRIAERFPGASVVLIGHSLGGRVACALAAERTVTGVVALAPWLPGQVDPRGVATVEPMLFREGQSLYVAHGTADLWCPPAQSLSFCRRAAEAGVTTVRAEVRAGGHFLLHRPRQWRRFVALSAAAMIDGRTPVHPGRLRRPIDSVVADLRDALDR